MKGVFSTYRKLYRLAKEADRFPARKALLQSPPGYLSGERLWEVSCLSLVRKLFRDVGETAAKDPHHERKQALFARYAEQELQRNIQRPQIYSRKRQRSLSAPPLTANQQWLEAKLTEATDEGLPTPPGHILREALSSRTPPTLLMCRAAARYSMAHGQPSDVLGALRALELHSPHVLPDADMVGLVVSAVLEERSEHAAVRALSVAECFHEAGTPLTDGRVLDLLLKKFQSEAEQKVTWALDPSHCEDILTRLGKVLIPAIGATVSVANLSTIEEYVVLCDSRNSEKNAVRAQCFIAARTMWAELEAEGDDIMGMPTD